MSLIVTFRPRKFLTSVDKNSNFVSDMQHHNHVTTVWHRCSAVRLQGESLVYTVNWQGSYDLADNRPQLPIRFLNLKTDQELVGFVRTWGPLWQELPTRKGETEITVIRSAYWAFQRRLKAGLALARNTRFDDARGLKTAILEYVAADDEWHAQSPAGKPGEAGMEAFWLGLLHTGTDARHPKEWIPDAPLPVLRKAAADCLNGGFRFTLDATWKAGRLHCSWRHVISNLGEAIELGLWNHFMGVRPVTICDECQTVFLPDSAHPRKFCSYRCAHRVAVRMWRTNIAEGRPKRRRGKHAKAKKA